MTEQTLKWRELFDKYRELIMYSVFGVSTTLVSWLTFALSVEEIGLNLYWAGIVSWVIAVIFAFVTNKLWVFCSKSWERHLVVKEALTFIGGRAMTGAIDVYSVPFLAEHGVDYPLFGVEGMTAKVIVTVLIVALNYILSKFISFN